MASRGHPTRKGGKAKKRHQKAAAWFEPAPVDCPFPWIDLSMPQPSCDFEKLALAEQMKEAGNESFKKGDYYDALWKYEHSCLVLNAISILKEEVDGYLAAINSNMSASCLKLGDDCRVDLLHSPMGIPIHQIMWYGFAHEKAHQALALEPVPKVAWKAHKRRGESFLKMISFPGMGEAMLSFLPPFTSPHISIISDYVESCMLQETPDHKLFYLAIEIAVNEDLTELIPPLIEVHVKRGFTTKILKEALDSPGSTVEHIEYVLFDMKVQSSVRPYFNASSISLGTLLRREMFSLRLYKKLAEYGMTVKAEDIHIAVNILPENKFSLFKWLVSTSTWEKDSALIQKSSDAATQLRKQSFLDLLKSISKNSYADLKEEGNLLFSKGEYEGALGKYFQALKYCREHKMNKEMSLIRANCAQACLKLQMFSDAYTHSCECVKLDKANHKGYYRRAESRKALIPTSTEHGGFADVVKDYLKCHSLYPSVEVFCHAVVLAAEHACTHLLPLICQAEITSGFNTEFFRHLVTKHRLTAKLLRCVVMKLPDLQDAPPDWVPYNASCIDLKTILIATTDGVILKRLLKWGVRVNEEDIMAATQSLPDSQVEIFELVLSRSTHRDDPIRTSVNMACHKALKAKKRNFILSLMKRGASPPPDELWQIHGLVEEPLVQRYLKTMVRHEDPWDMDPPGMMGHCQHYDEMDEEFCCDSDEECVHELNREAKQCFKRGDMKTAVRLYKRALRLCKDYGLVNEAAAIHCNLARLYLETKEYNNAYKHCEVSIDLCPNNPKAYARRGEAAKCALKTGKIIPGSSISSAICDFKQSFNLQEDLKILVDAALLASEHGKLAIVKNDCKRLGEKSRQKFLHFLLAQPSCKTPLLSFLMLEVWDSVSVNCSGISLKALLDKKLTDEKLLARFLDQGVPVTMNGIYLAIRRLTPADIAIFKKICQKCACLDLDQMCQEASVQNKVAFMLHFVELGACLPGDGVQIFMDALKAKDFHAAKVLVKEFAEKLFGSMDLGHLLDTTNLILDAELIEMLVGAGIKLDGKISPVFLVMRHLGVLDQISILCALIERGVDCKQLCVTAQQSKTPLHVATELALKSDGVTKLIEVVVASSSFDKSGKLINDKGETPLHLAAKPHLKSAVSTAVLSCLIQTNVVDPFTRDKNNKRACDYVKDDRVKLFEEAMARFNPDKKKTKKKKKKKKGSCKDSEAEKDSIDTPAPVLPRVSTPPRTPPPPTAKPSPRKEPIYKDLPFHQKLVWHLQRLNKMEASYFQVEDKEESSLQKLAIHTSSRPNKDTQVKKLSPRTAGVAAKYSSSPIKSPPSSFNGLTGVGEPLPSTGSPRKFSLEGLNFDDLPWEVEVTRNVVKFFKNTKKYSPTDRIRAASVIYSIAEGKRNTHLAKPVGSSQKVTLYEARITDSGRILWEKAITYSQKHTSDPKYPMYCQVVRIWEVILDHDELDRRIEYCSEQIIQSYDRGYLSSVRWGLKLLANPELSSNECVRGRENIDLPSFYTKDTDLTKPEHHFVPAASTNETEYSVTTFYSFDTVSVKSMISGSNEKRDYPFKEWQKENEIIKVNSKEAILLLGRSGTGKTTCCLYRLWNEFKSYWNPDSDTFGMKIPRRALASIATSRGSSESDDDTFMEDAMDWEESPLPPEVCASGSSSSLVLQRSHSSGSGAAVFVASDQTVGVIEEDLHQVFVTKNYVLCDQMRKRFFCMVAGCEFLEPHLEYEEEAPPNSFSKFEDMSFPAFLTARHFYILLDNSLGDGNTFFKRDHDGCLQVKISSLDYDHEDADILLDLEHSDSEDDDIEMMNQYSTSSPQRGAPKQHSVKWTEVTALYFKEIIWPKISHDYCKQFDPMLVWLEIQSFIKGSLLAVEKGSPLSFAEYREVGNRMAPNFSSHREEIYKLYLKYCRFVRSSRHSNYLFDECDLVLDLHNRLKTTDDVPWSIHSVYIDEVQDFTQAELAVFIHCCRDPNSMFFTGDTAQSIMRGIAFRFQDLRSCFHQLNTKVPYIGVPEEPLKLTINYRSHSGILKLAGSIIDLINEFFRDSIDHLPDDEGMFPGPMPVFLDSCEEGDLSLLMSANKRECSAIEFGAHQVILVQSKDTKDRLPDMLKGAIALTIFEAKGLEFDDVLLYNFFTDSLVDEKGWRVISSYLEKLCNKDKIENVKPIPGLATEPRSISFDPTHHKSLNAELKYLYTAITRAKCNLWIYDSNQKNRLPMLDYWHKRNAVKVVRKSKDVTGDSSESYNFVFASNSTPEQWAAQGDNFRKRHLWEQAILCYEKAGVEYTYLAKEACAYHFIQEARQQKPQLFQHAALKFFERDELKHSVNCINGAALCLKNSRPPKHAVAAKLFEQLGDLAKAAQCFLRSKDFENFARVQEHLGDYNAVIRSLHGKPFMRKREALVKADEYVRKGYTLDPKFTPSELSFSCAKFYSKKDKKILLEVLKYMPEHERRVKFLKEAELFKEAFEDYATSNQFGGAYRLALAKGWFADGKALAKRTGDESMEARFILQEAKEEYLTLPVSFNVSSVNPKVITGLKTVSRSKDRLLQAEANLLLGMLLKAQGQCIMALGQFKLIKHKAGTLEAFDRVGDFGKVSDQEILNCCHIAKKVATSLKECSDMNVDVKRAVKFCDFQLIGKVYVTSAFSNIWIEKDTLLKFLSEEGDPDIDSMLRLKQDVKDAMVQHYESFMEKWPAKFNLETRLQQKLQVFKLHAQLHSRQSLNRQYSLQEVSSLSLREYLQACVHLLELWVLKNQTKKIDNIIVHFVLIFSPQVYIYLPQCLRSPHVQTVRISENSRTCFADFIKKEIVRISGVNDKVQINEWLLVWRASCIALPSLKMLTEKISALEAGVNGEAGESKEYEPPPGFIYWQTDKRFCHIFSLWLNSCVDVRERSRTLWAAKLAITHFLGNIAEDKRISISVMNCVDLLSVHCTSLLAMITNANALQNIPTIFTVPLMYKHMVELFTCLNCRKGTSDTSLLAACVAEVSSCHNLRGLFKECKQLLVRAMGYLIGTHSRAPWFSMLKYGLRNFPNHDATRLCLILTLTLFCNLAMLKVQELPIFEDKIRTILTKAATRGHNVPVYVKKVYSDLSANSHGFSRPAFVLNLVANLLHDSRMDNMLSKLIFSEKEDSGGRIEFVNHQLTSQVKKPPHTMPSEKLPGLKSARSLPQAQAHSSPQSEKVPPVVRLPAVEGAGSSQVHPSSSELSQVQPVSPVAAPIGSERRKIPAVSSSHHSADPVLANPSVTSTLNPNATMYLPGFPNTVADPSYLTPGLPHIADNPSLPPPTHGSNESTYHLQPSHSLPSGSPNLAAALMAGYPQQYPGVYPAMGFPDSTIAPSEHTFMPSATDGTEWNGCMYYFQDENFFYTEDRQDEGEGGHTEYEESFVLTHLSQPVSQIDPNMIGEDIIDEKNSFCNVCGVYYQQDEAAVEPEDSSHDRPAFETYIGHVNGSEHHNNTVSYKRFKLLVGEAADGCEKFTLFQLAEKKLKDCKDLKADVETEQLDHEIDSLQDQINKYLEAIAECEDNRRWSEGTVKISGINDVLARLLKAATDQERKVMETSRQRFMRKHDEKEEVDEIDEFSARFEKELDQEVKLKGSRAGKRSSDGKMRTAEEKRQSRDKKRFKKQK